MSASFGVPGATDGSGEAFGVSEELTGELYPILLREGMEALFLIFRTCRSPLGMQQAIRRYTCSYIMKGQMPQPVPVRSGAPVTASACVSHQLPFVRHCLSFACFLARVIHPFYGATPSSPSTLFPTPGQQGHSARSPLVAHCITRCLRAQWSTPVHFVAAQTSAEPSCQLFGLLT